MATSMQGPLFKGGGCGAGGGLEPLRGVLTPFLPPLPSPPSTHNTQLQAGELSRFLVEDGMPVEYGQVLVELIPAFGGHIIGDKVRT